MTDRLRAGVVGRAHGVDGSFYVLDAVPLLLSVGTRVLIGKCERVVMRRAGTDERPIVRLEGCEDRSAAEALRGEELFVARAAAPALGADEWWAEELEGCLVRGERGSIGTVRRVLALPSCEVLEVQRDDGHDDLLVPLVADVVRHVDIAHGTIEVNLQFLGEG